MDKKYLMTLLFVLAAAGALFAQKDMVSVDAITGRANAVIPIYSLSSGAVSASIAIAYSGSGMRVRDIEGNAGMGWQVSGGGQISRVLRGLPDDCLKDNAANDRAGWLYNTNGSKINSLAIANTGTPNCTNETTDINSLNSNFSDLSDTEPDIFSIDAPGLSCSFVFDNSHAIKTIPYMDVKISYTTNATTGAITGFTVVNDKGVKYSFGLKTQAAVRQAKTSIGVSPNVLSVSESNIAYFKTQYWQFKYGVNYASAWYLDSMTDPNYNVISYDYTYDKEQNYDTPVELYIGSTSKTVQYWMEDKGTSALMNTIGASNSKTGLSGENVAFSYSHNNRTGGSLVSTITTRGVAYLLNYSAVVSAGTAYYRYFLRDVSTDQCSSPVKYRFSYIGETLTSGGYQTTLNDSTSRNIDFWGYQNGYTNSTGNLSPAVVINPSTPSYQRYQIAADAISRSAYTYSISGADRRADTSKVSAGALSQIAYFDNGTTSIYYESNDYYDPTSGTVVQGAGIRVKRVSVYDGISAGNNIVHTYSYLNPATGASSGKPVSLPVFAFTRPYTGGGSTADQWAASTVRSELDLSPDDHSILYSHVTMSQFGQGKTLYEYYLPATNYDASGAPGCSGCSTADWFPNVSNVARSSCASAGFISNDLQTYPFAPSTNYDFERGLLRKVTNFKDDGTTEVSEDNYAYQRTGAPSVITALKYDDDSSVKSYLKYSIYTSTGELSQQVTSKVFDLGSTTLSQQSSETYYYGSSNHKRMTQSQHTKSDGTVENTYIKYSKDYATTTISDAHVTALDQLKQQNINVPIEQYTMVHKTDGSDKVTSAELVKLKPFSFTYNSSSYSLYLPSQRLRLVDPNGFAMSGFLASTVSSGLFTQDSRYTVVENNLAYDYAGYLQTRDDNRKHVQTELADLAYHRQIAATSNAAIEEIGYYSYSNKAGDAGFVKDNGTSNSTTGRMMQASLALALESGATLSKPMKKNAYAKNYIFSAWANPSVTGSLSLTLTTSASVSYSFPINFTSTGGTWKYYEIKVPTSSLTSTFTASIQNTAGSAVPVDELLLYPESGEMTTTSYDPANGYKVAVTGTSGISQYYVNDGFGRVNLVYDQDRQITQRKTYTYIDNPSAFAEPTFNYLAIDMYPTSTISFAVNNLYNPCQYTGLTYTWDFGDGTTHPVTTDRFAPHAYADTGHYVASVTIYAPGYGTKTAYCPVTIVSPPPPPTPTFPIHYANNTSAGSITKLTLSQGGVTVYTFTGSALAGGTTVVLPGTYSAVVTGSGTIGSLVVDAGNSSNCLDVHLPTGKYSPVTVNLVSGNSLLLTISDNGCN